MRTAAPIAGLLLSEMLVACGGTACDVPAATAGAGGGMKPTITAAQAAAATMASIFWNITISPPKCCL
jgi:hypothetical protein